MRLLKLTVAALAAVLLAVPATISAAGELTIGLKSEPSSIDPHYHNLGPNNALARVIFDRLIMPDEKQQLRPGLAVSWKPIDDTTWEFKLREGVKFHDGSPFTADDVVFTPPGRFTRSTRLVSHPRSWNDSNGAACPGRYTRWTRTRSGFRPGVEEGGEGRVRRESRSQTWEAPPH